MRILAADPGINGAIALWDTEARTLNVFDMPTIDVPYNRGGTRRKIDMHVLHKTLLSAFVDPDHVIIEEVSAMPNQGVTSMFRFGEACGMQQMALATLGEPVASVRPAVWKKEMGLSTNKKDSLAKAIELFPDHADKFRRVKDADRAEATLLAVWYFRKLSVTEKASR